MWRVLKNIYKKVESTVRIDKEFSEWFKLETGVRQGCVLSLLLYALFINGVEEEETWGSNHRRANTGDFVICR